MNTHNSKLEIKRYSLPDLARLYTVSDKTFKKWLIPFEAAIGERIGIYYNIAQVKIIFDHLGLPGEMIDLADS